MNATAAMHKAVALRKAALSFVPEQSLPESLPAEREERKPTKDDLHEANREIHRSNKWLLAGGTICLACLLTLIAVSLSWWAGGGKQRESAEKGVNHELPLEDNEMLWEALDACQTEEAEPFVLVNGEQEKDAVYAFRETRGSELVRCCPDSCLEAKLFLYSCGDEETYYPECMDGQQRDAKLERGKKPPSKQRPVRMAGMACAFTPITTQTARCGRSINMDDMQEEEEEQLDAVTVSDGIFEWSFYGYSLSDKNTLEAVSEDTIIRKEVPSKVLENELLKVTLLPRLGGRIISIIYKPTWDEMLYINPVGVPSKGMGEGEFDFDWTMAIGGIYPGFPTKGQGKHWLSNYDWRLSDGASSDRIEVVMSLTDMVKVEGEELQEGVTCEVVVALSQGSSALEYTVSFSNPTGTAWPLQHWIHHMVPAGVTPTGEEADSIIVAPISLFQADLAACPWIEQVESRPHIPGRKDLFQFYNLASFSNWEGAGAIFAYHELPAADSFHVGTIRHGTGSVAGLMRVEDSKVTKGLRIWTWGARETQEVDEESVSPVRPYIEYSTGLTSTYSNYVTLPPGDSIAVASYYIPTVGLWDVQGASKYGALDVLASERGGELVLLSAVFVTHVDLKYIIEMKLDGAVVLAQPYQPHGVTDKQIFTATLPREIASKGADSVFAVALYEADEAAPATKRRDVPLVEASMTI